MAKWEAFWVSLHPALLCDLEQVSAPLWAAVLKGWSNKSEDALGSSQFTSVQGRHEI